MVGGSVTKGHVVLVSSSKAGGSVVARPVEVSPRMNCDQALVDVATEDVFRFVTRIVVIKKKVFDTNDAVIFDPFCKVGVFVFEDGRYGQAVFHGNSQHSEFRS